MLFTANPCGWADYLDRLSFLNFGPAALMCLWPWAVAARPTQPCNGASCTGSDRVLLALRLAGTLVSIALILQHGTHAQTTPACWQ